jgi:glyoxylase-like metal-dependent hydrolase (beta-lactamase superfamily II)
MDVRTVAVGAFEVNCFIVSGSGGQAIVIDPGADADRIASLLDRHRLSAAVYLLTHGHVDHISAVAALCRARPAPVALHRADCDWAFSAANQMPPFYGVPERPSEIARRLEDGQEWTDAGLTYRVLATPGHSPGSVSFHFPDPNALFCGDTLFAGSVGRTDLPGGDSGALSASLQRLAGLPRGLTLYPGHGPPTDLDTELRVNPFLQWGGGARGGPL